MPKPALSVFETQVCAHLRMFRDEPVILDSDLSWFLGVDPEVLSAAVARHPEAFPDDFVFRLTTAERANLCRRSACVTPRAAGGADGGLAFTTHGAEMLLVVLRDDEEFVMATIPVFTAFAKFWNAAAPAAALPKGARKS